MATIDVLNTNGEKVSDAELADAIFDVEVKKEILHEIVVMQMANKRSGTASVKNRSDITGSTRKLFRQKGTGRARRGNIKSPLLKGGGVVFGPKPKDYSYKVPKKVRKLALKMALSSKLKENEIIVLDRFELDQIKTKKVAEIANQLNVDSALIVVDKKNDNLERSAKNIQKIDVMRIEGLNVIDILKHKKLILVEPSIKAIEGRLS